jgi:hypothetical protein
MKYIKLFENHNEYYFIIDKGDWMKETHIDYINQLYHDDEFDIEDEDKKYNYVVNNWIPFTKDEISKLEEICGNKPHMNPHFRYIFPLAYMIIRMMRVKKVHGYHVSKMSDDISIVKLTDEWFYVMVRSSNTTYYKCDQFDGLLQLLQILK